MKVNMAASVLMQRDGCGISIGILYHQWCPRLLLSDVS